jgi:shikimate kinase
LLQTDNPEERMRRLMEERYPIYSEADITIESHEQPHTIVVDAAFRALHRHLGLPEPAPSPLSDDAHPAQEI